MKKIEDILKSNKKEARKRTEDLGELYDFLKENQGEAFTNKELEEKFNQSLPSLHLFNSMRQQGFFGDIGCIQDTSTQETYFYYRRECRDVR